MGAEEGVNWRVLGLFENSTENFAEALKKLTEDLDKHTDYHGHGLSSSYQTVVNS